MTHDPLLLSLFLFLVALLAIALWLASVYNQLVRLRNRADAMWAEVDVQLKRRHDLIPNLVRVVAGYASHERGTLEDVTNARNQAVAAKTPAEQAQAENVLTGALGRLLANVERYPELKAEGDFQRLEQELEQIETVIAQARQAYNLTVQAFNNAVDTFPSNVAAWFAGFEDRAYLSVDNADRSLPDATVPVAAPSAS